MLCYLHCYLLCYFDLLLFTLLCILHCFCQRACVFSALAQEPVDDAAPASAVPPAQSARRVVLPAARYRRFAARLARAVPVHGAHGPGVSGGHLGPAPDTGRGRSKAPQAAEERNCSTAKVSEGEIVCVIIDLMGIKGKGERDGRGF